MILVVCLNPALDITHEVAVVDWAGINRPAAVHDRPGGKGLNVARTLHALGADVLVTGLVGGTTGTGVAVALSEHGVRTALTSVYGPTRRTFTVVDERGNVAAFYEPGPAVGAAEFAGFLDDYREALTGADAVVLSGSLPPGLPDGTYATLIAAASGAGVPAVLDAYGEPLRLGAAAGPAIVKPNLPELEALAGRPLTPGADMLTAAGGLRGAGAHGAHGVDGVEGVHGAEAVVVTLGRDGLLAVTGDGCWRARPPAAVAGNATGAGDAVAAALAHGLVLGRPWDERLRHAVALGTATAAAPVAGEFRSCDYTGALAAVTVEKISAEEVG
ncbi:MAG TPA: hexose kinase [Streptosporangiaceae bacterium]|nr:hexose kinase [Streptosporangiaceae bacterium]